MLFFFLNAVFASISMLDESVSLEDQAKDKELQITFLIYFCKRNHLNIFIITSLQLHFIRIYHIAINKYETDVIGIITR